VQYKLENETTVMIILNYPKHCYTSRNTMQQHAELVDESELAVHSVPLTVNVDVQAEVSRPAQKMRQKFILRTVECSVCIDTDTQWGTVLEEFLTVG
jgi:hypothetical protein